MDVIEGIKKKFASPTSKLIRICAITGNADKLEKLLDANKLLDIGKIRVDGKTPLQIAVKNCYFYVIRHLVERCAVNVDDLSDTGETALHIACAGNLVDIASYLISVNAALEICDNNGMTPSDRCSSVEFKRLIEKAIIKNKGNKNKGDDAQQMRSFYEARVSAPKPTVSIPKRSIGMTLVPVVGDSSISSSNSPGGPTDGPTESHVITPMSGGNGGTADNSTESPISFEVPVCGNSANKTAVMPIISTSHNSNNNTDSATELPVILPVVADMQIITDLLNIAKLLATIEITTARPIVTDMAPIAAETSASGSNSADVTELPIITRDATGTSVVSDTDSVEGRATGAPADVRMVPGVPIVSASTGPHPETATDAPIVIELCVTGDNNSSSSSSSGADATTELAELRIVTESLISGGDSDSPLTTEVSMIGDSSSAAIDTPVIADTPAITEVLSGVPTANDCSNNADNKAGDADQKITAGRSVIVNSADIADVTATTPLSTPLVTDQVTPLVTDLTDIAGSNSADTTVDSPSVDSQSISISDIPVTESLGGDFPKGQPHEPTNGCSTAESPDKESPSITVGESPNDSLAVESPMLSPTTMDSGGTTDSPTSESIMESILRRKSVDMRDGRDMSGKRLELMKPPSVKRDSIKGPAVTRDSIRGPPLPNAHPIKRITPPALKNAPPNNFDLDDWEGEDSRPTGMGGSAQVQVYIDDFDEEEGGDGRDGGGVGIGEGEGVWKEEGGQGGGGDAAGTMTTSGTPSDHSAAILVDGDGDDDWM